MQQPLADRFDLWVDITEDYNGFAQSVLKFAKNPTGIRVGERIRVGDHFGNRIMAEVVEIRYDTTVVMRLDNSTYYRVVT